MREFHHLIDTDAPADTSLTLPFELRQRSRQRVRLDNGEEAGVLIERGAVLRNGQRVQADDGFVIEIRAADESVSTVHCDDPQALARAAYHLGNRHVALQVGPGWLRYLHDHVLDAMVAGLGLRVTCERAPFEPEAGAYHDPGGHHHGHHHGGHHHHD